MKHSKQQTIQLLMIADDFTGALDSGVQFSEAGATVKVVTDISFPFERETEASVLVLDAETRHLESQMAYKTVYEIVRRAVACGIPHIYKKTDSALRGNVGSELAALRDASGQKQLPFVPALPRMNRLTRGGIQYIEGVPVSESVFGKDPFEPVRYSYVPDILNETAEVMVACIAPGEEPEEDWEGIAVYDVEECDQMMDLAARLYARDGMKIVGGCAGLAEVIPGLLGWKKTEFKVSEVRSRNCGRMLIACGSVNPITRRQLEYAENHGFTRIHLTPEQKLDAGYWESARGQREIEQIRNRFLQNRRNIIDSNDATNNRATEQYICEKGLTNEAVREAITGSIGRLVKYLVEAGVADALMIMGGDTLMGFLREIRVAEMRPICELLPGTVLSEVVYQGETYRILSKSGGFGEENLLTELAGILTETGNDYYTEEAKEMTV